MTTEPIKMDKTNSTSQCGQGKIQNTLVELNELGLTREQALRLDIFKYIMNHTKSTTTSFSITNDIIRWLKE